MCNAAQLNLLPAGAREWLVGPKIALCFPRLLVNCASAHITCAINYISHTLLFNVQFTAGSYTGQATGNEGNLVLSRWQKLGRQT